MKSIAFSLFFMVCTLCFGLDIIQKTATIDSLTLLHMRSSLVPGNSYSDNVLINGSGTRDTLNVEVFEPFELDPTYNGPVISVTPSYISHIWDVSNSNLFTAVYNPINSSQNASLINLNDLLTDMDLSQIMTYFRNGGYNSARRALDQIYIMNVTGLMLDYLYYADTSHISQINHYKLIALTDSLLSFSEETLNWYQTKYDQTDSLKYFYGALNDGENPPYPRFQMNQFRISLIAMMGFSAVVLKSVNYEMARMDSILEWVDNQLEGHQFLVQFNEEMTQHGLLELNTGHSGADTEGTGYFSYLMNNIRTFFSAYARTTNGEQNYYMNHCIKSWV
jgi:hypothetical protein